MDFLIVLLAKYFYLLVVVIGVLVVLMEAKKERVNTIKLAIVALPLSFIFSRIAAAMFYNPRPFVVEKITPLIAHAADNGFPSDHTLFVMTISAIIFAYNKKAGMILVLLSLVVGLSRVLAKVHHGIDILGGMGIAFVATYICFIGLKKLKIIK